MAEQRNQRPSAVPGGPPGPGMGMPGRGPGGRNRMMAAPEKPKNIRETLARLWSYLKQQRTGLIIVFIMTIASSGLMLLGPLLIGRAIDNYIETHDVSGLLRMCIFLIGVYVAAALTTFFQSYVMAGVSQRTVWHIRTELFAKLQRLPLRFFDSKTHGELMSRTTNDVENISQVLNQSVTQFLNSIITLTGSLAVMLYLNVWLTLVTLVTIPLVVFITNQIAKTTRKHFSGQQKHLGELNGYIEETVTGQKVIKTFVHEQSSIEQFEIINDKLRKSGTKAQIFSGTIFPTLNVINNLNFALMAGVGGLLVLYNLATIGVVVSFLNYSRQFGRPINELANLFNMIQSAIAGAERVFQIMDESEEYETKEFEAEEKTRALAKPSQTVEVSEEDAIKYGKVVFDRVHFSYDGETPILKNISFEAEPGSMIALVGPTGAGKTTIVNLLTRFYEINEGRITIDGKDLKDYDKNALRSQLGIVLQDAYLFSDTIRENIRYGRLDATDEEVERAAKLANADTFIRKLPQGYDTVLTAEGNNLSEGQRQLLTIARAILAEPKILILDEATSSIDTRTEMHIQEAFANLMKNRTSFVIAHRLSTIREADMILVINNGEIIERGTHDELLEAKGFYYDLYTSQFKRAV